MSWFLQKLPDWPTRRSEPSNRDCLRTLTIQRRYSCSLYLIHIRRTGSKQNLMLLLACCIYQISLSQRVLSSLSPPVCPVYSRHPGAAGGGPVQRALLHVDPHPCGPEGHSRAPPAARREGQTPAGPGERHQQHSVHVSRSPVYERLFKIRHSGS